MYIAMDGENRLIYIDDTVPGRTYFCPVCLRGLSARRGEVRHHYFAHLPGEACSDLWEGSYDMSEWHREWQRCFPITNQEVVVQLGDIKHRADVLTGKTVIEFQHSSLSTDSFNKRNSFYSDLGYKVVWLFDLTDEYEEGKITRDSDNDGSISFSWSHPRNTFNRYDVENGQIELFLQMGDQLIYKVKRSSGDGFSRFVCSKEYTKEEFLSYFQCNGGVCPEPYRNDIQINEEYLNFKKRYNINLDAQQERAVETVDGANLVLAVPGSGKTTTLIARIGYMVNCKGISPREILALTYTTSAAADMKKRYTAKFGNNDFVQFRTINSLATQIVRDYDRYYSVVSNADRSKKIKEIYREFYPYEFPTDNDVKVAQTTISYIKNMMLNDEEIAQLVIWGKSATEVYSKYSSWLQMTGMIDFDDQLVKACNILKTDSRALENLYKQYKYLCVDEAQDTSKIQYEIIKILSVRTNNIFMVGDEDQSIYRFRAAYPKALLNFKQEYPNPFILQLETNYRSTDDIVDMAATFIAKNSERYPKKMKGVRGKGNKPAAIAVSDRIEQYENVVNKLISSNLQTAVLYRDNACVLPIADRLLKKGIPFYIRKPEEILFFHEHIVNDIRAFLKLALNDRDTESFKQIYYKCGAYIKKTEIKGICGKVYYEKKSIYEALFAWYTYGSRNDGDKAEAFERKIKPMSGMRPIDAIRHILDNGYASYLNEKGSGIGHVEILMSLAQEDDTIQSFFEHLDRLENQLKQMKPRDNSIILSTVHSSKGLEYDTVYLIDVFDGMFPAISTKGTEQDRIEELQEERRLFYVAMTRAKNNLYFYRIMDKASSFMDELFPLKTKTIDELLSQTSDNQIIVKEILHSKAYVINRVNSWSNSINAYEFDLETGEIASTHCNSEINRLRNKRMWEQMKN